MQVEKPLISSYKRVLDIDMVWLRDINSISIWVLIWCKDLKIRDFDIITCIYAYVTLWLLTWCQLLSRRPLHLLKWRAYIRTFISLTQSEHYERIPFMFWGWSMKTHRSIDLTRRRFEQALSLSWRELLWLTFILKWVTGQER